MVGFKTDTVCTTVVGLTDTVCTTATVVGLTGPSLVAAGKAVAGETSLHKSFSRHKMHRLPNDFNVKSDFSSGVQRFSEQFQTIYRSRDNFTPQ